MFDRRVLEASRGLLGALAGRLVALGLKPDQVSWFGFLLGICAVPLIATLHPAWALPFILANRLADGVDGAMARRIGPSDRGAFLDISLDFLFYSSIPLAFAIADPAANALAAAGEVRQLLTDAHIALTATQKQVGLGTRMFGAGVKPPEASLVEAGEDRGMAEVAHFPLAKAS